MACARGATPAAPEPTVACPTARSRAHADEAGPLTSLQQLASEPAREAPEPVVQLAKLEKINVVFLVHEVEMFENICAWCSEQRLLPFDLRSSFVCQDAGLDCCPRSTRAQISDAQQCCEDDFGLFANPCTWCGENRLLPFELGDEFVCRDVGLECNDSSANRPLGKDDILANACANCGCERHLPFDFGEEFVCEDAGYDCELADESSDSEDEEEEAADLFLNVCSRCGTQRPLPFDLRSDFVCGDAGLECVNNQDQEISANVCINCGETRMCPFTMNDGFVCGECSLTTRGVIRRFEEGAAPQAPRDEASDDGLDEKTKEAMRKANQRTQLLWKVLIQDMSIPDAAKMFLEHGHAAPDKEELLDLRSNTLENFRKKTVGNRMAAKSALKSKSKKGPEKRFLNNELVQVTKKDKYLRIAKESAEDKAKTSVELYIIGIGRGGRHAVKIAREEKKKGPRSHK